MNKSLNKLNNFEGVKGPGLTIVMDGVGLAPDTISNAVAGAYTPTLDMLMAKYPMVSLKAHGTAVTSTSADVVVIDTFVVVVTYCEHFRKIQLTFTGSDKF